jgi:hypothetical protein
MPKRCYILPCRSNLKVHGENSYNLCLLRLRLRAIPACGWRPDRGRLTFARPSYVQGQFVHQGLAGWGFRGPSG